MIAFSERSYGEIILHPPPLSYLSAAMVPFLFSRTGMAYISKSFSYFMFWLENIVFVIAFFLFELLIMPIAYIKVWINIVRNSMGILNTILNCVIWALIGIFMMFFLLFRDVSYLVKILSYHNGCRFGKVDELAEESVDPALRIKIYNETRATVISLYQRL